MDKDLLKRLSAIINEANDVIEENPESDEAEAIFGPLQELGWAVDQILEKD